MLKKKLLLFIVFILFLFALLTYQSIKGKSYFPDLPLYPLKILERGSSAVINSVKEVIDAYVLIIGKEEENRRLLDEVGKYRQKENRYIEAEIENERLKKLLELRSKRRDVVTSAEVFARDPSNWFQIIWIDKGSTSEVERDMVALSRDGPVGKVHRVLDTVSSVILITDVNSSIAVRLQSSRIEGILEGRGDDRCNLKYISKDRVVKVGEKVITSGLEGIYPEGLLVGYISAVREEGRELFQLVEVTPIQDLTSIEEVLLIRK
jgi:rod shape-determining protein MreC